MAFYPIIKDEAVLTMQIVVQSLEKDPGYLDSAECKYSDTVKAFFRRATASTTPVSIDLFDGEDDLQVIDGQIQKVLSDLEAMGAQMVNAEPNERVNYFKAKTTLLEKLVTMKEKVFNLKELNDFRNTLIATLEDICTKDQITTFMQRLDGLLGVKGDSK
jgi:hypothetical protein